LSLYEQYLQVLSLTVDIVMICQHKRAPAPLPHLKHCSKPTDKSSQ